MKLAYQDQLEANKPRQLEFVAGKRTEPKIRGRPKHDLRVKKRQYGLEAYGVPKEGQMNLQEVR